MSSPRSPIDPIGVLVINLGTPDAPTTKAVRRYLREFLSDPRVLDINPIGRWFLLNLIILPRRPAQSAEAYRKVWTEEGSPLLVESERFRTRLADELGAGWHVELGMRYGEPSLKRALDRLLAAGAREIVVLPAYPQDASSSTGTALEELFRVASERWKPPSFAVVPPFYEAPGFLDPAAERARAVIEDVDPDHVLLSFHGLPERHIHKGDPIGGHCLASDGCCDDPRAARGGCYRAQCHRTATGLISRLGLAEGQWSVGFQSRLGRTPWIRPFTDEIIVERARSGSRRMVVLCPAFVADCLETLEEIGLRAREDYIAHGGEELVLVPAVNDHPAWIQGAADLVRRTGSGYAPPP